MMLKELALLGALHSQVSVSSRELGESLGISQQSASRMLRELRDEGMVEISRGRRTWVIIGPAGRNILMEEYSDYRRIFESSEPVIKGRVESGLGEGSYYLSKKGYVEQIREKLGFTPYPGTLNLRLDTREMAKYRALLDDALVLSGFTSEGRTFGDVLAVPAKIDNVRCAVITPKRSHYSDVVEVISPVCLREAFTLSNGDSVEIILESP